MKREIKVLTSRRPNSTCAGFCLSFQARWPLLPTNSTPLSVNAWLTLTGHRRTPKGPVGNFRGASSSTARQLFKVRADDNLQLSNQLCRVGSPIFIGKAE